MWNLADDLTGEIKQLQSVLQAFKSLQRSQIPPEEILEKDISQGHSLKKRATSHDLTPRDEEPFPKVAGKYT